MVVLIPAFEPDSRLTELISRILESRPLTHVVVVDDGSGPGYAQIFERVAEMGCDVLTHSANRGKGHALKQGFAFVAGRYPGSDVVTADSDGQHTVDAIFAVGDQIGGDGAIVLGARDFSGRQVPFRSRFGNVITRLVFALSTGRRIADTQTGLRGYDASILDWLRAIPGERFEYEMNVLLEAVDNDIPVVEVPIETIYIESNGSSHFRPLADSARVYGPLLRFSVSSLGAFVLDFILLLVLSVITGNLLVSVVFARVGSATFNFLANRFLVFRSGRRVGLGRSAVGYVALAAVILSLNYGLMYLMTVLLAMPLVLAKIITETVLFLASYAVQRRYVFAAQPAERPVAVRARS